TFTSIKVTGQPVFCMNRTDLEGVTLRKEVFEQPGSGVRRELILAGNVPVGVTSNGEWGDLGRLYQRIVEARGLAFWRLSLFRREGELWLARKEQGDAPESVVCNCAGVTRAALDEAVESGAGTVDQLAGRTGASRICGACAPRLVELVGESDTLPAELIESIPVTESVRTFRFKPVGEGVRASQPGQHVALEAKIDGEWIRRSYTLTSPANGSDTYEVSVKREPDGVFSSWLHDRFGSGDDLRISHPKGEYYLREDEPGPIIFLAAGIGITPALAMARTLQAEGDSRTLRIYYSATTRETAPFAEELQTIADATPNISLILRETGREGRMTPADVAEIAERHPGALYFLCGPERYLESMQAHLDVAGVPGGSISVEAFTPGKPSERPRPGLLTRLLTWGSGLIITLLVMAGLAPPLGGPDSVNAGVLSARLWTESLYQSYSGYAILCVVGLGLAFIPQKRFRIFKSSKAGWLKLLHIITGLLAVALLSVHTGLAKGSHLNLVLWLLFSGSMLLGSLAMVFASAWWLEPGERVQKTRNLLNHLHIYISWPLPALIAIHVLSVHLF
ncbi:MAG: (2Fe-2S)-binding protein, partial [Magnetococcales bacterium]|nr:(2Fe-2S)-binding protein [Magnetococcales bacterium]